MNYDEFMKSIQSYYGSYPEDSPIPKYVMAYLKRDIKNDKLKILFRFLTYHHPYKYGPPGISELEKSIYESIKNGRGEDVHKVKAPNTIEDLNDISESDLQEGKKLLDEAGGLSGIFKEALKNKEIK